MTEPKPGWEPMHPTAQVRSDYGEMLEPPYSGLTKREWFAGLAMQGIISSLDMKVAADEVARAALMMADALLKELDK